LTIAAYLWYNAAAVGVIGKRRRYVDTITVRLPEDVAAQLKAERISVVGGYHAKRAEEATKCG
jgi:hypothetical protein